MPAFRSSGAAFLAFPATGLRPHLQRQQHSVLVLVSLLPVPSPQKDLPGGM